VTLPGYAATPDVMTIIDLMKGVHESALEMAQKIDIHIKSNDKVVSKLMAGLAQKQMPTGKHALIVLLEPEALRGFAYLYKEKDDMTVDRWIYPPAINRIRRLVEPWNAYDSFLNTDFTYADLGFVDTKGAYRLLGQETVDDTPAYKVEKIPESPIRYYSRIITWISKETYLPIRRDYYDIANRLYKRQLFENIFMVGKTPVPYKITMINLQTNSSTILSVNELKTGLDLELPDDIFMPERLKYSATCPIWERICYPSEQVRKK
jgi:hypothetical protein